MLAQNLHMDGFGFVLVVQRNQFAVAPAQAVGLPYRPVMEAVWALIGQGLAYIDYSQSAAENWALHLTEAGLAAARDEEATPDDPAGYLRRLHTDVQ